MPTSHADQVHVVYCTCPDRPVAESLAAELVQAGLAACATLLPGALSIYRWQGNIERADEVLLLIKTTGERLDALTARILASHPYDVPEVIAHPITAGHDHYLDWVRQCTTTNA
ncbi:divalent-cation tolerance protein CutA [Thiohalocapsa sp. ML1]|jgi:periplasmic divalent cation tolerance protein|uniref:divalent-cation tolerance protein CutA n=1 Tax=Thiohalocapsa sp. ML1 TaxID=1431688 RepID=UPI0007320F08|nr:divalent-cation tolerance protein CutA [Thiohalocapsa sp. ML1]